jgi:hypothetical protein
VWTRFVRDNQMQVRIRRMARGAERGYVAKVNAGGAEALVGRLRLEC